MPTIPGVHLLPSTGEFSYDPLAYSAARSGAALASINTYYAPGGSKTDYSYAIDQLQSAHPECATVAIVCSWFCDGVTAGSCRIYPSTTFIGGAFSEASGLVDHWRVSGLTETSSALVPIPTNPTGAFIYGGTPSDQSMVRCIRDLKSRGLRVIFYPFLLLTCAGLPWRGQITYAPDNAAAASAAVAAFLGAAAPSQFSPDATNLTVNYAGSAADFTFRRMILHYASLVALAGGVNLFVLGSELRGLDTIRGPGWSPAGGADVNGAAVWDYPFVSGLATLAADVRSILDAAGLTKNLATHANLITYSADWSNWMGYQHAGANGQWPHLDALWSSPDIDVVAFDNYLPLSDWTTGIGGLDAQNWSTPRYAGAWPPPAAALVGLGLSGPPTLYSPAYLKANIEGGEKFDWFYADSENNGPGFDPAGSGLVVSRPHGDRLIQSRQPYYSNQQLLGNKQLRWWWNNSHRAIYDDGDGTGWSPHGPATAWIAQSKPIIFLEYGVPPLDKGTNQPNVFFSSTSSASATPYWSDWTPSPGGGYKPSPNDTLPLIALQAIYDYWNGDGNNLTSFAGVPMVDFALSCVWSWDARPFPTFPILSSVWADAVDWPYGDSIAGKGPALPPLPGAPEPGPAAYSTFPTLPSLSWAVHVRPQFSTDIAESASGRSTRRARRAYAGNVVEMTYELLRGDGADSDLQTLMAFFLEAAGARNPFWYAPPGSFSESGSILGVGDGVTTDFPLQCSVGAYSEPAAGVSNVTAVYLNGVPQSSGWTVSGTMPPLVTLSSPPVAGVTVTADFAPLWLCRFADDLADFENFAAMLWTFRTVTLRTVRP